MLDTYLYPARLITVVDGYTLLFNFDLGFGVSFETEVELYGVRNLTDGRVRSKVDPMSFIKDWFDERECVVRTIKRGSSFFGYVYSDVDRYCCLNDDLVDAMYHHRYD